MGKTPVRVRVSGIQNLGVIEVLPRQPHGRGIRANHASLLHD